MRVKEVCRQEANSEDWVSAEVDLEMGSKSSGSSQAGLFTEHYDQCGGGIVCTSSSSEGANSTMKSMLLSSPSSSVASACDRQREPGAAAQGLVKPNISDPAGNTVEAAMNRSNKISLKPPLKHRHSEHWEQIWRDSSPSWGSYYHRWIQRVYGFIIPKGARVLELGCGSGDLLASLQPEYGFGIDFAPSAIANTHRHPGLRFG